MKEGISAMHKMQDRPMKEFKFLPLTQRLMEHSNRHPADLGNTRQRKGITWGKVGKQTKKIVEFHKNHVYTFVDKDMNKAWVQVSGFKEEEE
tara:strand:- start:20496 stop:20771 length:276 start_codon:yes stop_codon:yes gene_type:complete